jgi:MYXO-CTERM domain-containing protein
MFVFDVTGSMGTEIEAAKASADDILSGLDDELGTLRSGSGWYSDPLFNGVQTDLNGGNTADASGVNLMLDAGLCTVARVDVDCGRDFSEVGYDGIADAARNADWAAGANRFVVAFGDASFKNGVDNQASTIAALLDNNVTLLGVSYDSTFTNSMTPMTDATGGEVVAATAADDLVDIILVLVTGSFAGYSSVTVDDFGAGLPGIGVSVVCTGADIGTCSGDTATGDYDRSVDRTFTFDVTFTALQIGGFTFETHAVVDGGIVAAELDEFEVGESGGEMPTPGTLALLGLGLAGIARLRRRRA